MNGEPPNAKLRPFFSCVEANGFKLRAATPKERKEDIDFVVWHPEAPSEAFAVALKKTLLKKTKKRTHLWGWVELRNRHGKEGWIYKKCTFIIYERKNDFAFIFKKDLRDWIAKENIPRWDLPFVKGGWHAAYRLYRRQGTQEAIFHLKVSDALKHCRHQLWSKK